MAADHVITVRGEEELAARAGHLFGGAATEFICAATDMNTWSRPRARAAIAAQMRPAVAAGLVVRKLYSPAVLGDEQQRLHLYRRVAAHLPAASRWFDGIARGGIAVPDGGPAPVSLA